MKKFLKYTAIGFAVGLLFIIFSPMLGGLVVGGVTLLGGYWLYGRSESQLMKLVAIGIMLLGAVFSLESIPALLLLAAPVIGYYVYNRYNERESDSPFDQFEKQWAKLTK